MFHGRDPFNTEINPNAKEAEELAEFKVSNAMKLTLNSKTDNSSCRLSFHDLYPVLIKKALVVLVQFATSVPTFAKLDFLIWRA